MFLIYCENAYFIKHSFRPFVRKGTFKVEKPKTKVKNDASNLNAADKKSHTNDNLDQNKKLRDLSINIK